MTTKKGLRIDFLKEGAMTGSTAALCAAPVVTTGVVNRFSWGGKTLSFYNDGQNDDICPTLHATLGWVIPNDNTDNDGIEINTGAQAVPNKCAFVIGTDPAFYVKAKFNVPLTTDYDVCAVGFRLAAANAACASAAALATAYTDAACINVDNGDFKTVTSLNTSTDVTTDITTATWADTETHTLTVKVSAAGAVTYFVDDVVCPGAVAFSFDTGDTVIPFLRFTKDVSAAADTPPVLQLFECGLQ
jgi:hypothetical protein